MTNKRGNQDYLNVIIKDIPKYTQTGRIVLNDGRVMGLANDRIEAGTKMVLEAIDDGSTAQLWTRGPKDKKGYFVLRNVKSRTWLTATSVTDATIEGTYSVSHIEVYESKQL